MQRTKNDYLTHTWNPIAMKCTPISPGCAHCWHIAMAKRLAGNPKICNEFKNAYGGVIPPVLIHTELEAPLHLHKPARIGVQFMGDLFHEAISPLARARVFLIMREAKQHTYLLLTKRPQKAAVYDWFEHENNWWLGITVCNQAEADEKIPILLQIPSAHRWVSVEPMLGAIDLLHVQWPQKHKVDVLRGGYWEERECLIKGFVNHSDMNTLDWIVCGGETGPGARPLHPDWVRSLRDQCQSARIPFFFKQWGGCPFPRRSEGTDISNWISAGYDPYERNGGNFLDGRTWEEYPEEREDDE